jgi:hypothetical protein
MPKARIYSRKNDPVPKHSFGRPFEAVCFRVDVKAGMVDRGTEFRDKCPGGE